MNDDVLQRKPDDPVPDGYIPVRAGFQMLDAIRVDVETEDSTAGRSFVVFRRVTRDTDPNGRVMMELSGAKTVNVWYIMDEEGNLTVMQDLEVVSQLEQSLAFYEDHMKATAH